MPDTAARPYGFRFSWTDAIVLALGAALTWGLWRPVGQFALLVPFTLGHFLLFCNVFRVGNRRELFWTAVFVVNFTAWVYSGDFSWWGVLAVQAPVTLGIVVAAARDPRYHGVFTGSRRAAGGQERVQTVRHTLFAYVERSDLEHVHDRVVESLVTFVETHAWRVLRPRVVDQRFLGDSGLGPGDLPQWDLGLNADLPDPGKEPRRWEQDVEDIIRFLGPLSVTVERVFVVGLHDNVAGFNEDLLDVSSATPDLDEMWRIIGKEPPTR